MNHSLPLTIVCLLTCSLLTACGTAQVLRGDASGGEVMLSGSYIAATTEARALMAEHCNGRFGVEVEDQGGGTHLIDAPNSDQYRARFVCTARPTEAIASVAKGQR